MKINSMQDFKVGDTIQFGSGKIRKRIQAKVMSIPLLDRPLIVYQILGCPCVGVVNFERSEVLKK